MIVVPDAGPLIYLGGAGQLELLRLLYVEVVVPRIVVEEVVVAGAGLTGAEEVACATWLRIEDADPDPDLLLVLDRGEAAAIPLAGACTLRSSWMMPTRGRSPAIEVFRGRNPRVLLSAKRGKFLVDVAPVIARMERLGMFVSARLRKEVLRIAGETG